MENRTNASARKLRSSILRSVSRSFYVSIRLLPRRLREPVGLAYLLARATDTIADTVDIPAAVRLEALRSLSSIIRGDSSQTSIDDLSRSFASQQSIEAERTLIEALPECLHMLDVLNAADRGNIRDLLDKITKGQALDIDRFGKATEAKALNAAADLHEYTYLVAGCVGEFWTQLCFRYIANFGERWENQMLEMGKQYGKGLQLVNILRDAHVDLRNGRCYFPQEELTAIGLSPSTILQQPERFAPVYQRWLDEAQRGLEAGMEYVRAINHFRVRGATALPALIGARTLSMLRGAGAGALETRIKVPRREVRGMIGFVAITLASRKQLDEMFRRESKR
jgi:farnesyl-diphosphate farnesyltransferase